MIYLKSVTRTKSDTLGDYPFQMAVVNGLDYLEFVSPVTFLIGENGCGKTTFLESLVHLTSTINLLPSQKSKMNGPIKLSHSFKASWQQKTSRGFYLKSQSFITFIEHIESMRRETHEALNNLRQEYTDRSDYALVLAEGPYLKTLHALTDKYGEGLDKLSHGEGYLEMFKSRLVPNGLYILDEPELSLSPMRQLSLIALIKEMVSKGCQFIIITHSPILMAFEDAVIYQFDETITKVAYKDVEHVNLTRDFLNDPNRYLRYL